MAFAQKQTQINRTESLEINPIYLVKKFMKKEPRRHNGERTVYSTNSFGKLGSHTQMNETKSLSYAIHENKLKMD